MPTDRAACDPVAQHGTEPVQQVPAGAVLDAEMLAQAHGRDRLGRAQHEEHGEEPVPQRQVRAFKGRADRDGELLVARLAAVEARPGGDGYGPTSCQVWGQSATPDGSLKNPS